MTKKFKLITGICAIVFAIGLNTRHALNGYGIKDVNLHAEALERTPGETCFQAAGGDKGMPMGIVVTYCGSSCLQRNISSAFYPNVCQ